MKIRKSIKLLSLLSLPILPIAFVSCGHFDQELYKAFRENKFSNLRPKIVLGDNESDGIIPALEKSIDNFVETENNVENTRFQRPESDLWFKYYDSKYPDREKKIKGELNENIQKDLNNFNIFFIQDNFDYSKFRSWLFDNLPNNSPLWKEKLHESLFFPINPNMNTIINDLWNQIEDTKKFVVPILIRSQDPNWIVGYASAAYLANKFPKDNFKRKISFILNTKHKSETNNLVGFLAGVSFWNSLNPGLVVKVNNNDEQIFIYSPGDNQEQIQEKIKQIVSPDNSQYHSELIFVASPNLNNLVSKELTKGQQVVYNDFNNNNLDSLITIKQDLKQFIYDLLSDIYTHKKGKPEAKILKSDEPSQQILMHLLLNDSKGDPADVLNSKYFKFKVNQNFKPFFYEAINEYFKDTPALQDINITDSSLPPLGTATQINETNQDKIKSKIQDILKKLNNSQQ